METGNFYFHSSSIVFADSMVPKIESRLYPPQKTLLTSGLGLLCGKLLDRFLLQVLGLLSLALTCMVMFNCNHRKAQDIYEGSVKPVAASDGRYVGVSKFCSLHKIELCTFG